MGGEMVTYYIGVNYLDISKSDGKVTFAQIRGNGHSYKVPIRIAERLANRNLHTFLRNHIQEFIDYAVTCSCLSIISSEVIDDTTNEFLIRWVNQE